MPHENVYGICDNKCLVKVEPKENTDAVEARVTTLEFNAIPIGTITPYAGEIAPNECWKICDGSSLSTTDYSELYAVIGTNYGSGLGTFNLPDLRGRVPIGVSSSHTFASTGGAETHKLTVSEMPSHNHTTPNHSHRLPTYLNQLTGNPSKVYMGTSSGEHYEYTKSSTDSSGGGNTSYIGGGQAHNNMQPYLTLNYIIRVK